MKGKNELCIFTILTIAKDIKYTKFIKKYEKLLTFGEKYIE